MNSTSQITTIFRDSMVQDFVIKIKDETVATSQGEIQKAEYFYMMLSSKADKINKFYLEFRGHRIFMRSGPDHNVLAYIDIDYARIKLMKNVDICGKTLNGIRFIKNKNYEEIFHQDFRVVEEWFQMLKRFCILSKFRESYNIKEVIGKGNFAKVYVCTRIADGKNFAVKIFDKKLILQDKFERVTLVSNGIGMPAVRIEDDARG